MNNVSVPYSAIREIDDLTTQNDISIKEISEMMLSEATEKYPTETLKILIRRQLDLPIK